MLLKFKALGFIVVTGVMALVLWKSSSNLLNKDGLKDSIPVTTNSNKIILEPSMVIQETMRGDAGMLVDEQAEAGDPDNGKAGKPSNKWETGWNDMYFPAEAVIDLGLEYDVKSIYLFDTYDHGSVTVSTGTPFKWQQKFNDKLESYFKWNGHSVNAKTRFIKVSISNHVAPVEIVVYGTPAGKITASIPSPTPHLQPTMDKFIGINAFIDDPIEKIKVAGVVREYHNWNWDEGNENYGSQSTYPGFPKNQNTWNPSVGNWNFDEFYQKLSKEEILVSPVLQGSVNWISKAYGAKPINQGESSTEPKSYEEHADHLFQFIARYGSKKHSDEVLKLAPGQARISGLGYLKYIEDWNEQDAWWAGKTPYFSPYEYSAMASADYDGHLGTMGKTFGVKNADSTCKMVMGGIARLDLRYIKAMKFWADYNRNGSFPADVINVHHYSNDGEDQANGKIGISPEEEKLKEKLKQFVDYRNRYLPGKEVWITEFGYDTKPGSPQSVPAIGDYSVFEVQGQWLVRSYLELAAAGVDRACMFMLRDVDSTSAVKFNSSGLVTNHGVWNPKPAWYYVYTLKNTLTGVRFSREISVKIPKVKVYEFKSDSGNSKAFAVWCPTSDGTIIEDFKLPFSVSGKAKVISLKDGHIEGEIKELSPQNNTISVRVTESPIFVVLEGK